MTGHRKCPNLLRQLAGGCERGHHHYEVDDLIVTNNFAYHDDKGTRHPARAWIEILVCQDCGIRWWKPTIVEVERHP